MSKQNLPTRCRLVLIIPDGPSDHVVKALDAALAGGDVASLILPQYGEDEDRFQERARQVVAIAHGREVAVMISGDTRVAARVGADGVHFEGRKDDLADLVERLGGQMMVGTGGAKTRDDALELGEVQPDYMFFGRFGYDNKPEAHNRNLSLGRWWAEMIELPCIVMCGNTLASVADVAATGVEFVAASAAIFEAGDPAVAVAEANAILEQNMPERTGDQ